jgi:hypothetical protein
LTIERWQRGATIVARYPAEQRMVRSYQVTTGDPVVNVGGWPHVVLQDTNDLTAVYMPEGTKLWRWNLVEGRFREPRVSQGDSIRLFFPGKSYEVSLFYETGTGPARHVQYFFPGAQGRFYGWKIDLTSPFARTEVGLDMIDETLDIVVRPDRTFIWKDEDQMELLVELGIYSAAEAERIRSVGHEVIDMVDKRAPPFDDEWIEWRPDPDLLLGEVPQGWQFMPVPTPYVPYDLREDPTPRLEAATKLRQRT